MKQAYRAVIAIGLALVSSDAAALTIITNNTTITTTVADTVQIGSISGGSLTNPVVTLGPGGQFANSVSIYVGVLRLAGGTASGAFVDNFSALTIAGGTSGPSTLVRNYGVLEQTGGAIQLQLQTQPDSFTSLRGGTCFSLDVQGGSVTVGTEIVSAYSASDGRMDQIRGGYAPQYYPDGVAQVHFRGGLRSSDTHLFSGNAQVYFYGSNLTSTFVATNVFNFLTTSTQYRLTGVLQDGTVLTNLPYYIEKGSSAAVFLIQTNVDFPAITVASNESDSLQLAWPHPSFGYVPQVSTNFGGPAGPTWSDLSGSPVRVSTTRFLSVTTSAERATYRLLSR